MESETGVSTSYGWDNRNRLVSARVGNDFQIVYAYDAFNRLVSRRNAISILYWVYDEGINPIYQFDNSMNPNLRHRYLWSDTVDELLADEPVTSLGSGGNTLWGLADHLGTIRDISDLNEGTGVTTVVNHRRYNAFGNRISQTGAVDVIFGYTGKLFDESIGLQNNLNRWYDPNLGKWISQDPIGFGGGDANLYRYVGNKVTMQIDPSGLEEWMLHLHDHGGPHFQLGNE